MALYLIGVYEDGADPRGSGVPATPQKQLEIIQGEGVLLTLLALHSDGAPVDTSLYEFFWSIKKKRPDSFLSMTRQGTPMPLVGEGVVQFYLTSNETVEMSPGQYVYDVWMTANGGIREPLVPFSPLLVQPSIFPVDPGPITPNPGPPPPPYVSSRVYNATLSGAQDGSNQTFALPIFRVDTQAVFFNGMRLAPGVSSDYTIAESGGSGTGYNQIIMAVAPIVGDVLLADYDAV